MQENRASVTSATQAVVGHDDSESGMPQRLSGVPPCPLPIVLVFSNCLCVEGERVALPR